MTSPFIPTRYHKKLFLESFSIAAMAIKTLNERQVLVRMDVHLAMARRITDPHFYLFEAYRTAFSEEL